MLRKWLEINYPNEIVDYMKVWRQYERLEDWLNEYHKDIYFEYLDIVRPVRVLEALLLGVVCHD